MAGGGGGGGIGRRWGGGGEGGFIVTTYLLMARLSGFLGSLYFNLTGQICKFKYHCKCRMESKRARTPNQDLFVLSISFVLIILLHCTKIKFTTVIDTRADDLHLQF